MWLPDIEKCRPTPDFTGASASRNLRRSTLDEKHAPECPVQGIVGLRRTWSVIPVEKHTQPMPATEIESGNFRDDQHDLKFTTH
jgi:hypothetical protein